MTELRLAGEQMKYEEILKTLKAEADPKIVEGMQRFGIRPRKAFGVSLPVLRKLAKVAGRNHALAKELWAAGYRETQILAAMVDEPEKVTAAQTGAWTRTFDNWEICDQSCMNLFKLLPSAPNKAKEWADRKEEFVRRAGFALIACIAWSDKRATDGQLETFLPIIKKRSSDSRPMVKKAVNWALRQIGKRNRALNKKAIRTAKEIQKQDSKSAKWVASDALRELTSDAVRKRLR